MSEDDLLREARNKSDPGERTTYLDAACAGDEALRRRIEQRLTERASSGSEARTHDTSPFPHGRPDPFATAEPHLRRTAVAAAPPNTLEPLWVGPYRLVRQLGEGGMGVVYLAEQERPVRRQVALKIIKPGMGTQTLVTRFQAERQALALMEHPNIAKVLDAGTTRDGLPFFVMELVEGQPVTLYSDGKRLTVRERLQLFLPVCRAIQHAHQKGIIHRDVKPSNVLVAEIEGRAVPKVIDFGVAKATDQRLTEDTLQTQFGAVLGTLEYMSPEQAGVMPGGVDTRSDVYSLGVLLYELLCGSTPLSKPVLRQATFADLLRMIREDEPQSPSVRVREADTHDSVARLRGTEPAKLARQIRGELDWIVLKALEKDRDRRYEAAESLARDVERHLHDDPVEAGPPSPAYRVQKFARKHRALIGGAAALTAVLVAGAGFSAWQALRATRAEGVARAEKARADDQAATALAVSDFLQNDLLARASPEVQGGPGETPDPDVSVATLLDRAAERIAGRFDGKPLVEAAVRQTIGTTYKRLGRFTQAEPHLERARELQVATLGEEHPDTLASMNNLALLYQAEGKFDKAESLLKRTLETKRRVLGDEHPDTLMSLNNLGWYYKERGRFAEAEPLLTRALDVRRRIFGDENSDTLASMNNLGLLYESEGRPDEAEALLTRALAGRKRLLGPDHPNTLSSMNSLGSLYRVRGLYEKARPLLEGALEGRRRVLRDDHPDTLMSLGSLGLLHAARGDFDRAEALFAESLQGRRRLFGERHPATLASMTNLGLVYLSRGEAAKAEPLLVKALEGRRELLGADHPDTVVAEYNLGVLCLALCQYEKAEAHLSAALEAQRRRFGAGGAAAVTTAINLAKTFERRNRPADAESLLRSTADASRTAGGRDSAGYAAALTALGQNLLQQAKFPEAEVYLREGLQLYEHHTPDAWQRYNALSLAGASLLGQKKYAAAEPMLLAAYEGLTRQEGTLPADAKAALTESAERLAKVYVALGENDKAARVRKQTGSSAPVAPR